MSQLTGSTPFNEYLNRAFGIKVEAKDVKPIKLSTQASKNQSTDNKGKGKGAEEGGASKKADKKAQKKAEKEAKKAAHKKGGAA